MNDQYSQKSRQDYQVAFAPGPPGGVAPGGLAPCPVTDTPADQALADVPAPAADPVNAADPPPSPSHVSTLPTLIWKLSWKVRNLQPQKAVRARTSI